MLRASEHARVVIELRKPPIRRVYDPEYGWILEAEITDLSPEELKAWLEETFPDAPNP